MKNLVVDENFIDYVCKELLELESDIKPKIKRITEIKDWCKELGSFTTENHVCAIKDQSQQRLVSLEKAVDRVGRDFLESRELIQTITFQTVHIAQKVL